MKKAVILDLGNVVFQLDWETPLKLLGLKGTPAGEFLIHEIQHWTVYDQYERDAISTDEFIAEVGKLAGKNFERQDFERAWARIISDYTPGAEQVLSELSKKYALYALTNTSPLHLHLLRTRYPELSAFRKMFNSVDLKLRKPQKEIFQRVEKELGLSPQELFYVDDTATHVDAAKSLGWNAVLCEKSPGGLQNALKSLKLPTA